MAAVLFLAGLNSKLKLMLTDACDGRRLIVILCLIQLRLASGLGYLSCDRWRNLNGYICLKCCWNNFDPPPPFFYFILYTLKMQIQFFLHFFVFLCSRWWLFFFFQVQQSTTQSAFLHVLYFYYIFLFFPPACNLRHCHTILYHIK